MIGLKYLMELMELMDNIKTKQIIGKLTWAGIGVEHSNALLASTVLEEALLRAVLSSTGQTREIDQHGDLLCLGLRGQVEVEFHLAFCGSGGMAQFKELSTKGSNGCVCGDRHFYYGIGYGRIEKKEKKPEIGS
jgi:hypothetical protein